MRSARQTRKEETSSYPRPWWLDDDDHDLHRTAYADETSADVDDGKGSTCSSVYIDDTQRGAARSSGHRGSPQQAFHSSSATPSNSSTSKFNVVGCLKRQMPPCGKDGNAGGNSSCATVDWNCEACTYLNIKDIERLPQEHPIPILTCAVCGTPHMSPLISSTNNASNSPQSSNTDIQDDTSSDPVEAIERTFQRHQQKGKDAAPAEKPSSNGTANKLNFNFAFFQQKRPKSDTTGNANEQSSSGHTRGQSHSDGISETSLGTSRTYSVSELIASLGENDVTLPPALERRVRDFKFAQAKRRDMHGDKKAWGIYGLYDHLSDIRADLEWAEDAAWRRQRGQPYLSWKDFEKSRDRGLRNRPLFTYGILFLCTIMMFVTFGVNGWKFEPLNVNPLIGPSSETLIKCGARDTNLIVNEGQWYRLFTPMILHAGLVHFFVNMLALYFIGGAVEQSHGFASAAVLFIIPAVGGNIISAICLPQYISVGASGGIFGMIGGCIADICLNWKLLFLKTTMDGNTRRRHFFVLLWLGLDMVVNCLLGFTPFVDNFSHLGGFMYGFCCGISTIERLAVGFFGISTDKCSQMGNTVMRFFGLIVSIIAIMVTTLVLVQMDGTTSPCHGCRYISCIPFPPIATEKWWYCDDCDTVKAVLFRTGGESGLYEQVNIDCPSGEVQEITIADDGINDEEVLRRALPGYCRANCENRFASG